MRKLGAFAVCFLLPFLVVNAVIGRQDLPDYGTWTGIRPLEQKLRQLEAFARAGPVDAVVLGSSIAEFGVNAEKLSEVISESTGRPYRAFNFASGGAEVSTFLLLYKLIRSVAQPRTVMLAMPFETKLGEEVRPGTPDHSLMHAPVQVGLAHAWFLPLWRRAWEMPILRFAAPLKDLALYGSYYSLQGLGSDLYPVSDHGDRVSFLFAPSRAKLFKYRQSLQDGSPPPVDTSAGRPSNQVVLEHYFGARDLAAARELKEMATRDGCQLVVVAHGSACLMQYNRPLQPSYQKARREFFAAIAHHLGAPLHFFLDTFTVGRYAIADETHLNRYGAALFSERLAESLLDDPVADPEVPRQPQLDVEGRTFGPFSFILLRRAPTDGTQLRLNFVESRAVPPLDHVIVFVALRTPDKGDVISPGRLMPNGDVVASFPELSAEGYEVYVGRLLGNSVNKKKVALSRPLAGYRWAHP